jgi:hypothetical protein
MKISVVTFFTRLVALLLILFVVDFIVGETLRYFYFRQKGGWETKTTFTLDKMQDDIVIVGSSRASHHYVSKVLENTLGGSAFNTGRDGNYILYSGAVIEATLNRYSPKLVILDIREGEFEDKPGSYDYLSSLLPYYRKHEELRPILNLRSPYEPYKLISRIYPFNSLFPVIAQNTLKPKYNYLANGGYDPLTRTMTRDFKVIDSIPKYEIDQKKVDVFKRSIQHCKEKDVPFVVITSPYFDVLDYSDASLDLVKDICKTENILYLDYSRDNRFKRDRSQFDDFQHLNDAAAINFTQLVADTLKSSILTKRP